MTRHRRAAAYPNRALMVLLTAATIMLSVTCLAVSRADHAATPWLPEPVLVNSIEGGKGSGIVIAPDWLLTAAHVLPVTGINEDMVIVSEVHEHPTLDLALVKIEGLVGSVPIADVLPSVGERLFVSSWQSGAMPMLTTGLQSWDQTVMSCPIVPGCSGGGVFDDAGRLVGVVEKVWYVSMGFSGIAVPHMAMYAPVDAAWILKTIGT